uniref:Pseudouridine synthase RsuA/RluA-like domain-containing protein n=1 Tax=Alexandrium monilatum TaxID=311494 RepID=A0A7S4V3X4_9DINO
MWPAWSRRPSRRICRLPVTACLVWHCLLPPAQPSAVVLKTVFQRGGTLVVHKPAGLSSEQRDPAGESALRLLRRRHPDAQLPHRLDRLTGGVLVVATEREALRWHNSAIKEKRWGPKVYVARLAGSSVRTGEHRAFMRAKGKRAEVGKGKVARLDVLLAAPVSGLEGSAVDVVILLRTGRYHQIRAMMAAEGAPVLGDELYGGGNRHTPLLTHALLGLPLPDGGFQVVRAAELAPRGCAPVSRAVRDHLEMLSEDVQRERQGQ